MKISVVIPTFDRADFLASSLDSVLSQTHSASEIIVVDDGSSDHTREILQAYEQNHSLIKTLFLDKNHGVSRARNEGIGLAQCEWIALLDSDDLWHKDKLKHQVDFHLANPKYLISQCQEVWIKNGKIMPQPKWAQKQEGDIFLDSLERCLISASSVLIHRAILGEVGLFDESFQACEDYDLWLRIARKYPVGLVKKQLIDKIAGHDNQLSDIWGLDRFRVVALQKHLDSKHSAEVRKVLLTKYRILLKGALKKENHPLSQICQNALNELTE